MSSRTYHDPLHGGIALHSDDPAEALVLELVDAAPQSCFEDQEPRLPLPYR